MEERIRVRIGTVLNDNGVDILSEDGGSLLHSLYRVIEKELDKAERRGLKRGYKLKDLDLEYRRRYELDGDITSVELAEWRVVKRELKLLEEENGKQNAR